MRDLTDIELRLVSGGSGECEGGQQESYCLPDIVVTGHPPPYYPPNFPPYSPPSPSPFPNPGSPPPVYTGDPPSPGQRFYTPHPEDCSTAGGVANSVMKQLLEAPEGPRDWKSVEFFATIIPTANGAGLYQDRLISTSNVNTTFTTSAEVPQAGGPIPLGTFHNHPDDIGDDAYDNGLGKYPSSSDWQNLAGMAGYQISYNGAPSNYNPSIFLADAFGDVREFKLSDRSHWEQARENGAPSSSLPPIVGDIPCS